MKKRVLAGAAAALFVAACATAASMSGTVLPNVFTETGTEGPKLMVAGPTVYAEDADGAKMASKAENQGALQPLILDMPRSEAVLNSMVQRVRQHWPHDIPQEPKVKLFIERGYQGAAYADGTIILSLGTFAELADTLPDNIEGADLVTVADSDDEILYLLSHEFAHIALGHHNKKDFMESFMSNSGLLTRLYNTGSMLSQMRYRETYDGKGTIQIENQGKVASDFDKAIGTFDMLNTLTTKGLTPAWNRSQEDEADVLGLDLIRAEGIPGSPYENVFMRLSEHQGLMRRAQKTVSDTATSLQSELMSPENITQAIFGDAEATGANIFENARKGLFKMGRDQLSEYLTATHRDKDVRMAGVQKYEINAYEGVTAEDVELMFTETRMDSTQIDSIRSTSEFHNAIKAARAYYASVDARSKGDLNEAERQVQTILDLPGFNNQPTFLFEAGRVNELRGVSPAVAVKYYKRSGLPEGYRRAASIQIKRTEFTNAEKTIDEGTTKLGDVDYFLPSKIELALGREQTDEAASFMNECRGKKSESLVGACEAALIGKNFDDLDQAEKDKFIKQGRTGGDITGGAMESIGNLFGGGN